MLIEKLERRMLRTVDFVVSAPAMPPTLANANTTASGAFTVPIVIHNIGTTSFSGQIHVNVVLSRDTIIGNVDDVVDDAAFINNTIAAGATLDTGAWLFEFDTVPGPGDYFIGLIVDSKNESIESNETNNTALSGTKLITVVSKRWPDDLPQATLENDIIVIQQTNKDAFVTVNGVTKTAGTNPSEVFIDAMAGNDKIFVSGEVTIPLQITGGGGNDTIVGGLGEDELSGANGKDKVFGGGEDDYLLGGASADYLNGEDGDDTCSGAGGNDRIISDLGHDYLLGGAGDDVFVSRDIYSGFSDTVSGGSGNDRAQLDDNDTRTSIEELLA